VEREQHDSLQSTQEERPKVKEKTPWTEAEREQVRQMLRMLATFLGVVVLTLLVMAILWNFVL
jgi:hypothetical protein